MSGLVKGVKKVFKKIVKVAKKIWKPLAIGAAVFFTAGAAGLLGAGVQSFVGFGGAATGSAVSAATNTVASLFGPAGATAPVAASTGLLGSLSGGLGAVASFVEAHPVLSMSAMSGLSGVFQNKAQAATLKEQREWEERNRGGTFFTMGRDGSLPTKPLAERPRQSAASAAAMSPGLLASMMAEPLAPPPAPPSAPPPPQDQGAQQFAAADETGVRPLLGRRFGGVPGMVDPYSLPLPPQYSWEQA